MNTDHDFKRGYSNTRVKEMGFPTHEYHFPSGDGFFTGSLVMKKWGKTGISNLTCYFETTRGEHYKLCVWYNKSPSRSYRPTQSDLDISYLPLGTMLRAVYETTSAGKTKWIDAEIVDE